jgi:hypothetical protein
MAYREVYMIECRRLKDGLVVVRLSPRRYQIAKLDGGHGFYHGFTNLVSGDWLTAPLTHSGLLIHLRDHPELSEPSRWDEEKSKEVREATDARP